MSASPRQGSGDEAGAQEPPAVRDYLLIGVVGLVVLAVGLVLAGLDWWALLPLFCGALGLLTSWGVFPPLLLMTLTGVMLGPYLRYPIHFRPPTDLLVSALTAVGVLTYVMAHYRLAGLVRRMTPPDGRRARGGEEHKGNRDPATVGRGEAPLLLLGVALGTAAGFVGWLYLRLAEMEPWLDMTGWVWAAILLVAVAFGLAVVFVSLLGYLGWQLAGPTECMLYLQDQVWAATRGEQRRIQVWLAWARKVRGSGAGRKEEPGKGKP